MHEIAVRRLRILPYSRSLGAALPKKHRLIILAELAALGVRITNPEALAGASIGLIMNYQEIKKRILEMRGGDVQHVPLFTGFPDNVPDDHEYFTKRLLGYFANSFHLFDKRDGPVLENGLVIPTWLLDLRDFGADPITQQQYPGLFKKALENQKRRKGDTHVEWLDFEFVEEGEVFLRLQRWVRDCLYAGSSIKEVLHDDLREILRFSAEDIDFSKITRKENQALLLQMLWEDGREDQACGLARTPTDLLRLFAALTNTDVNLAEPIRFPRFTRRQRRQVLGVLEGSKALHEDLKRYRGLWLEIGRYLHPGEHAFAYPRVAEAFGALRNGAIMTFNGTTEACLALGDIEGVLRHLSARPGVLGRKLHELLRKFPTGTDEIVKTFSSKARYMTLKNLLVLQSYFRSINDEDNRCIVNKRGKIKIIANTSRGALTRTALAKVNGAVERALLSNLNAKLGESDSWAGLTCWVDPVLDLYTVPLQQRKASEGLLTVGRGSRIPLDTSKVLRLFTYWKQATQRTDLDLSVIQFDQDFRYAGHVSYTNLRDDGIIHSGDLQSAPHGAAEFIDIVVAAIKPKVRYLAVQIYRYVGDAFADMEAQAGWMVRDCTDRDYRSFDVKTVEHKVDLTGRAAYSMPLIVDLLERDVIMTDLYMGNRAMHNRVEGECGNVASVAREIARFIRTRPTLGTLARLHVEARRGDVVDLQEDADVTFGKKDCTYDVTDVEKILADLL